MCYQCHRKGACATSPGKQAASDSNGYVGLLVPADTNNYAEYISCKLGGCASGDCPLTVESYYRFSMDVSLAERWSNTGSDALGAWFMTDTLPASFKTSIKILPMAPQVDFSSYGAITDTANWITLVDTFVAIAPYKYIIIGGVKKFQDMSLVEVREFGHPVRRTYYYIDNVKLQQIPAPPPPPPPPLGVEAIAPPVVTISPNPVRDKAVIRISGLANAPYSFVLTNMLGQRVRERSDILDEEIVFDTQGLPSGYIITGFTQKTGQFTKANWYWSNFYCMVCLIYHNLLPFDQHTIFTNSNK